MHSASYIAEFLADSAYDVSLITGNTRDESGASTRTPILSNILTITPHSNMEIFLCSINSCIRQVITTPPRPHLGTKLPATLCSSQPRPLAQSGLNRHKVPSLHITGTTRRLGRTQEPFISLRLCTCQWATLRSRAHVSVALLLSHVFSCCRTGRDRECEGRVILLRVARSLSAKVVRSHLATNNSYCTVWVTKVCFRSGTDIRPTWGLTVASSTYAGRRAYHVMRKIPETNNFDAAFCFTASVSKSCILKLALHGVFNPVGEG